MAKLIKKSYLLNNSLIRIEYSEENINSSEFYARESVQQTSSYGVKSKEKAISYTIFHKDKKVDLDVNYWNSLTKKFKTLDEIWHGIENLNLTSGKEKLSTQPQRARRNLVIFLFFVSIILFSLSFIAIIDNKSFEEFQPEIKEFSEGSKFGEYVKTNTIPIAYQEIEIEYSRRRSSSVTVSEGNTYFIGTSFGDNDTVVFKFAPNDSISKTFKAAIDKLEVAESEEEFDAIIIQLLSADLFGSVKSVNDIEKLDGIEQILPILINFAQSVDENFSAPKYLIDTTTTRTSVVPYALALGATTVLTIALFVLSIVLSQKIKNKVAKDIAKMSGESPSGLKI